VETARRAGLEDVFELARLRDAALDEIAPKRGGRLLADDRAGAPIEEAIEDPDRLVVVGEVDGVAVGLGVVRVERSPSATRGAVEMLYVEPGARGVGVGEAMLGLMVDWSSSAGCVGVDAPALPGSRVAKAFFETQGFVTRLLVMHLPIGIVDEGLHDGGDDGR
jgi:GNAT superfamily N-acetyltransferase